MLVMVYYYRVFRRAIVILIEESKECNPVVKPVCLREWGKKNKNRRGAVRIKRRDAKKDFSKMEVMSQQELVMRQTDM
jgi:hypothetical protein